MVWRIGIPQSTGDADAILIFGGDGTVHRHLGTLVRLQLPVLIVPRGSGNDFARALGLRSVAGSLAAWRAFCSGAGNVRTIDLGTIRPNPQETGNSTGTATAMVGNSIYFCCVGGIGLDGEIARRANRLPRWLRGHGGYVLSLPLALATFAPISARLAATGSPAAAGDSAESVMLIAFANAPAYGGGIRIAPHAQLDDGRLDVCVVQQMGKARLLRLFPTVYSGRHTRLPQVKYFQTTSLRLETPMPIDVYADGEFVCQTPVVVSTAPNALRVICNL